MTKRRASLVGRLILIYAVTFLAVLVVLGFLAERAARNALLDEVQEGLEQQARTLSRFVPAGPEQVQRWVADVAGAIQARITVVARDGDVLGDSLADPAAMENHADRAEIREAREGGLGVERRLSATTGFRQLYVAVPTDEGAVLRLSLPQTAINQSVADLRTRMLLVVGAVGLVGVLVVALVARRLARPLLRLSEVASSVAEGDLDVEVPRSTVDELDRLAVSIEAMATELGERLKQVDDERRTLEVVLGALPQGTLLVGDDDAIVYANRAFGDLVGPAPSVLAEVVPFRIHELVRTARETQRMAMDDVDHGLPVSVLRLLASPVGDGRVLVVVRDITERRRVLQMRTDFVTNASHELKTPVATILASAETLQTALDRAPDRVPQFAEQIERSARSLARLIDDLLDLSRLEGRPVAHDVIGLAEVVHEESERIREMATKAGVSVNVRAQPVEVMGSAADMALAVRNLLDNAVRYTEAGGNVDVKVDRSDGEAVLVISDTGTGIPQRDLDRIFERFYRVDVARSRSTGGTGLGLSIVRHVVEIHGGSVEVQSELGAGSTFTVRLPAVV